jgi:hypothetical protein
MHVTWADPMWTVSSTGLVRGRFSTTSQAMRGYIQEGELFVDNPSAKLGL